MFRTKKTFLPHYLPLFIITIYFSFKQSHLSCSSKQIGERPIIRQSSPCIGRLRVKRTRSMDVDLGDCRLLRTWSTKLQYCWAVTTASFINRAALYTHTYANTPYNVHSTNISFIEKSMKVLPLSLWGV